ncbi:MAG: PqiC family protein [Xanthomonadales bacterium]|nr:PqiC family protein [Xanthomonadales bacterium]
MLLVVLVAGGCSSSGGGPGIAYYLIDPVDAEPIRETDLSIEILDLRIPQYLERYQIASRTSQNRLRFSEAHQWGETLRKNLARTLSRNLTELLGTVDVATPFNRLASRPDLRLLIDIDEFEARADRRVHLVARWQLALPDGTAIATERVNLAGERPFPAGDYGALVGQMRQLFGELSRRIARSIAESNAAGEASSG